MKKYRYILEKYQGRHTRHTCPKCGQKHQFTRYIDSETGKYIADDVGKCNRTDKCGYHRTPSQYFEVVHKFTNPESYELVNHTIDKKWCIKSRGIESDFIKWLSNMFPLEVVSKLIVEYHIGNTKDRGVIFWQRDRKNNIRTGKIMRYNPQTGRRLKSKGAIRWVHSILKAWGELSEDFELKQCIFGEHLFGQYPDRTIAITESYKSACVGFCVMPQYIWACVDSMQGLSTERCLSLRGRNVIFFPDLGKGYTEWSLKIPILAERIGFKYTISQLLERTATEEQRAEGYDIADYISDRIWQGVPLKSITQRIFEEEQTTFNMLAQKNPLLDELTERFDLVFDKSKNKPKKK